MRAAATAATVTEAEPETVFVGWEQNRRGADEIDAMTVILHGGRYTPSFHESIT
jgi:hypothetical protein